MSFVQIHCDVYCRDITSDLIDFLCLCLQARMRSAFYNNPWRMSVVICLLCLLQAILNRIKDLLSATSCSNTANLNYLYPKIVAFTGQSQAPEAAPVEVLANKLFRLYRFYDPKFVISTDPAAK